MYIYKQMLASEAQQRKRNKKEGEEKQTQKKRAEEKNDTMACGKKCSEKCMQDLIQVMQPHVCYS